MSARGSSALHCRRSNKDTNEQLRTDTRTPVVLLNKKLAQFTDSEDCTYADALEVERIARHHFTETYAKSTPSENTEKGLPAPPPVSINTKSPAVTC